MRSFMAIKPDWFRYWEIRKIACSASSRMAAASVEAS